MPTGLTEYPLSKTLDVNFLTRPSFLFFFLRFTVPQAAVKYEHFCPSTFYHSLLSDLTRVLTLTHYATQP